MKHFITALLITLPALATAETITLANGQRCTKLSDGRIIGCTAPNRTQDAPYSYSTQRRSYGSSSRSKDPQTPKSGGWTPRY